MVGFLFTAKPTASGAHGMPDLGETGADGVLAGDGSYARPAVQLWLGIVVGKADRLRWRCGQYWGYGSPSCRGCGNSIFHMPISSPQRIRMFGCCVAMICSFLNLICVKALPASSRWKMHQNRNAPSNFHLIPPLAPPGDAVDGTTVCSGMTAPFSGELAPRLLKGESGSRLPWQKRNFRPLPQGQGS